MNALEALLAYREEMWWTDNKMLCEACAFIDEAGLGDAFAEHIARGVAFTRRQIDLGQVVNNLSGMMELSTNKLFHLGAAAVDRVVISDAGEALPPAEARLKHTVEPDVVFLRDDGWMLGAARNLEKVAHNIWADKWVAFARLPDTTFRPIADY